MQSRREHNQTAIEDVANWNWENARFTQQSSAISMQSRCSFKQTQGADVIVRNGRARGRAMRGRHMARRCLGLPAPHLNELCSAESRTHRASKNPPRSCSPTLGTPEKNSRVCPSRAPPALPSSQNRPRSATSSQHSRHFITFYLLRDLTIYNSRTLSKLQTSRKIANGFNSFPVAMAKLI